MFLYPINRKYADTCLYQRMKYRLCGHFDISPIRWLHVINEKKRKKEKKKRKKEKKEKKSIVWSYYLWWKIPASIIRMNVIDKVKKNNCLVLWYWYYTNDKHRLLISKINSFRLTWSKKLIYFFWNVKIICSSMYLYREKYF